ncbi:MAG: metallophosphoesterase [Chloroflexi bacterium]|nr:metallophosphoesterase [Chloroflexota bacterium]
MLERNPISVLRCGEDGHQIVVYGDSCSGVAGALHEKNFQQVNETICALEDAPDFVCFLGDEIMGLTIDRDELRRQWRYFFERELAWLDRGSTPLYHTTGNHTVYDPASEDVFRKVMAHLPQNGPRGLSYFVRRGDLLMIFVNTLDARSGGEGTVETAWLENVLRQQGDATHKLVFGHHPVWAVNGYCGDYQRLIERENGRRFWDVLLRHNVLAYFCSHILAFDVQAQAGILQICTAGAGTAHRMPPGEEYLHFMQVALDEAGLRYQVVERKGRAREWLCWDWKLPPSATWATFEPSSAQELPSDCLQRPEEAVLLVWEIGLRLPPDDEKLPQTILCATGDGGALPNLWLGISGVDRRITVLLSPEANRSPHRWLGPALPADRRVSIQVAVHSGMGPGGLLWRWSDDHPWSSMAGASAWGVESLPWLRDWRIGECAGGQKFRGRDLRLKWHHQAFKLSDYR